MEEKSQKLQICTKKLCNMLFAFAFLAVNNVDVKKRVCNRAVRLFAALFVLITNSFTIVLREGPYRPCDEYLLSVCLNGHRHLALGYVTSR